MYFDFDFFINIDDAPRFDAAGIIDIPIAESKVIEEVAKAVTKFDWLLVYVYILFVRYPL